MRRLLTSIVLVGAGALLALPAGAAPPPAQRIAQLERQVAALKTKVAQLRTQKADLDAWNARAWRRERALRRYAAASGTCPVTRPNGSRPPGSTFGDEFHGNGKLWVGVPPSDVVVDEPDPSGAVDEKFGWWRGVTGALRIDGRHVDGPAPPLRASIPDGYGDTGFQSTAITFPVEGCWEVTGRAGDAALTFTTLVLASGSG